MSEIVQEIYPAPNSFGELPINIERVQAAIERAPDDADLRFLLGNAFLRTSQFELALEQYRLALSIRPSWAEVRCNVGIAFKLLGRLQEAVSELHQVILAHPELHLAHWHLAQVRLQLSDSTGAVQVLERLVAADPKRVDALLLLGKTFDAMGKPAEAVDAFSRVLVIDPQRDEARRYLAIQGFEVGRKLFAEGEIEGAFRSWFSSFAVSGEVFLTDDETVRGMKQVIQEFARSGARDTAIADFRTLAKSSQGDDSRWPGVIRRVLFSQGLIPALFIEDGRVLDDEQYWRAEFEKGDEPPYARYRLAVNSLYQGRCAEAFENLRICADRMPEKKQEGLRIPQLLEIVHSVIRSQGVPTSGKGRGAKIVDEEHWKSEGFPSPFQWRSWSVAGFSPEEARRWRDAGLSADRSRVWEEAGFSAESAKRWEESKFTDVTAARRWHRAGFSPADAELWSREFSGTFEVAVQCRQVGFSEPHIAEQWMRVFSLPWDAVSWFEVGFSPAEALEWTYAGFSNAYDALSWKKRGVSPQQASMMQVEVVSREEPSSDDEM